MAALHMSTTRAVMTISAIELHHSMGALLGEKEGDACLNLHTGGLRPRSDVNLRRWRFCPQAENVREPSVQLRGLPDD